MHYHFLDEEEFERRRDAGGFLEANLVHGHWYGTPRDQVRDALLAGRDAILKIDVQGAAVVKQKVPEALLVFLVPPSLEDLFSRLQARATETADELDIRQRNAALELARPGRLRPRRAQRDRPGRAHRRARRRDHPRREGRPPGPAHAGLTRVTGPRLVAVAVDAAGAAGKRAVHVPRAGRRWPTSSRARPCSSSSGAGRRWASCSGRAAEVAGVETKPIVDRVRADGPLLPALGDAARRVDRATTTSRRRRSRCGRCSRRACSSGSSSSRSGDRPATSKRPGDPSPGGATAAPRGRGDPRRARRRPATGPHPRSAGGPARAAAPPARTRGPRPRRRSTGRCWRPAPGRAGSGFVAPRRHRARPRRRTRAGPKAPRARGSWPCSTTSRPVRREACPAPELAARHGSSPIAEPRASRPRRDRRSRGAAAARSAARPSAAGAPPGGQRAEPRAGGGGRRPSSARPASERPRTRPSCSTA